jgi:hypothetical protein
VPWVFRPSSCGKISTMLGSTGRDRRIFALSDLACRVLQKLMLAVARTVAPSPDARKIAGVCRALQGATGCAAVPVTAAPVQMQRLLAANLIVAVMVAGVTPCFASSVAKPVSKHDCCPPDQVASASSDAAPAALTGLPVDCCLVTAAPVPAAKLETLTTPIMVRDAALVIAPAICPDVESAAVIRAMDHCARSSPRPPIVTVLLI